MEGSEVVQVAYVATGNIDTDPEMETDTEVETDTVMDMGEMIKTSMATAGNWRAREACVALSDDCSVKAPCRTCRQKARDKQQDVENGFWLLDEHARNHPAWKQVKWVDVDAEPKKSLWGRVKKKEREKPKEKPKEKTKAKA